MGTYFIINTECKQLYSKFDGLNYRIPDYSREEAEKIAYELNQQAGKELFRPISIQEWLSKTYDLENKYSGGEIEKIIESFNEKPEIKKLREDIYEQNNNYINGIELPIVVNCNEEYIKKAKCTIDSFFSQVNKPAFSSQEGLVQCVNDICEKIKEALDNVSNGNTSKVDEIIESIINKHYSNGFLVSDLDKSYSLRGLAPFKDLHTPYHEKKYDDMNAHQIELFRGRPSEKGEKLTNLSDIVHVPYSRLNLAKDGRFSTKKRACLYLGTTSYVCYMECGIKDNDNRDFYISCFIPNEKGKNLKILNLTVSQHLINGLSQNRKIQNELLKIFPLIIATSFSINNDNEGRAKFEYVISQSLMRVIGENEIDGVAYLSCKGKDSFQYPHGVNLAIPVNDIHEGKEYGKICSDFSMTYPVAINMADLNDTPIKKTTYINEMYNDSSNIMSYIHYPGSDDKYLEYSKTKFSKWDNYMVNREFVDFSE